MDANDFTADEQRIETRFRATLSQRELDEYRVHLEAGGKPACKFVSDPGAPVFAGLDVSGGDADLQPYQFDPDLPAESAAGETVAACEKAMSNLEALAEDIRRYDLEVPQRYETAARRLGLEHVLGD